MTTFLRNVPRSILHQEGRGNNYWGCAHSSSIVSPGGKRFSCPHARKPSAYTKNVERETNQIVKQSVLSTPESIKRYLQPNNQQAPHWESTGAPQESTKLRATGIFPPYWTKRDILGKPEWKASIPQGKPWTQEALTPFPPQGTGYLTVLSLHSLGRRTIMMVPFLSLRWGIRFCIPLYKINRIEKKKNPAATYSPTADRSTIGVRVLNFRVRDGNGCIHLALATGSIPTLGCRSSHATSLGSPIKL